MGIDVNLREQRLRKRAELQQLVGNLAHLREREASYIDASAAIPELLLNQINEVRQAILSVEDELLALKDETVKTPAHQAYREAVAAELSGDASRAIKLYKHASRSGYSDAGPAIRSSRYRTKLRSKVMAKERAWETALANRPRRQLWIGGIALVILVALGIFLSAGRFPVRPQPAAELSTATPTLPATGQATTATATPTPPAVVLVVPDTATPTAVPAPTATPVPTEEPPSPTPSPTPSPAPTLRSAPRILEPKNGLTWGAGAIVFEFEELNLADDELYCVNTLRGFDKTGTENWSYPPVGSKKPHIPIEDNVFRVARTQGMKCIVWSGSLGKGSCENVISQNTEDREIGLPQPCNFKLNQ